MRKISKEKTEDKNMRKDRKKKGSRKARIPGKRQPEQRKQSRRNPVILMNL